MGNYKIASILNKPLTKKFDDTLKKSENELKACSIDYSRIRVWGLTIKAIKE